MGKEGGKSTLGQQRAARHTGVKRCHRALSAPPEPHASTEYTKVWKLFLAPRLGGFLVPAVESGYASH